MPAVSSDGRSRVDLVFEQRGDEIRASFGSSGGSGGSAPDCELTVVVMPTLDAVEMPEGVFDDAIPVQVRCGQALVDERWVPGAEVVDVDAEAAAAAQQYLESVLAPSLSVQTSPPSNILVGLPTWFWFEGWDGEPIATTVTAPWGEAIQLELTLDEVTWSFGDGTPTMTADLGQPYPRESSVQHVYTDRSTSRDAPDGAHEVSAQVRITVRYWYQGEGPFSVPALEHTHEAQVVVRQLQAVIG